MTSEHAVLLPKTWRSEIWCSLLFVIITLGSLWLSRLYPDSFMFEGSMISVAGTSLYLRLPLLWLAPAGAAFILLFRMYNVRFIVDERGIEGRSGILGTEQIITRVRYEDVRSVETRQSILDRVLGIGHVEIGTAATGDVEITFSGVANPLEIQELIQQERDRRQAISRKRKLSSEGGVNSPEGQISVSE